MNNKFVSTTEFEKVGNYKGVNQTQHRTSRSKIHTDLKAVIEEVGLKSGMTISFHHHFRAGDKTMKIVMDVIASLGIKDLTIAASSLTSAHNFLIDYIKDGTVLKLETSGCRGELAKAVSQGVLKHPMIIRSHGGRAAAIESGRLKIDIAFLAVSSTDCMGNANGVVGKSPCGAMGYAMVDSKYANRCVLLTDTVVDYPNFPISINQTDVDYIAVVDEIGDSSKIMSGATRFTSNPKELLIAQNVVDAIKVHPDFKTGFSFQTGSGGASLAVTRLIKSEMIERNIIASFGLGGITSPFVDLLEEGLITTLFDTQSFDLGSSESILRNEKHVEVSAANYASCYNRSCITNMLDFVILSALEVDVNFNVNVMTGSDGVIMGASGGHSDAAFGAKTTIITVPLIRGRIPSIVDRVQHIITPGESVDVIVSDVGISVNPLRQDLVKIFNENNIEIIDITELKKRAYAIVGEPKEIQYDDEVVALIEYRDGTIIDEIKKIK